MILNPTKGGADTSDATLSSASELLDGVMIILLRTISFVILYKTSPI